MSDLIAEMVKTMKDWRYLEPIFSSGDIINTMPAEGKMFKEVDSIWKTTMQNISEEPWILDLAEKEGIMHQF